MVEQYFRKVKVAGPTPAFGSKNHKMYTLLTSGYGLVVKRILPKDESRVRFSLPAPFTNKLDILKLMIKAVVFDYGGVIYKNLHWHNDMFKLAGDLRANGYKTAILSNMIAPLAWMANRFPSTKDFSPVVISADVGHSKPKPEIYHILLDKIGLNANECLFIDDRPENLATAKTIGFETMLVKKPATTIKDIRQLLKI